MTLELCSCGSTKYYGECCEPIIRGTVLAETPEALMRSRYTAYVKHEIAWLKDSLEPSQQGDFDDKNVEDWSKNSEWLGLEIRASKIEGDSGELGWVEFMARFKQEGVERLHHELGEFRKVAGKWFFYEGHGVKPSTFKHEKPQVGRNDPCTCVSGKKFKKCCGA